MVGRTIAAAALALCAVVPSLPAAGASLPMLLVPADNALLPTGRNVIMGRAGVDNGLARVEVNGSLSGFAVVGRRIFHAQVTLPEGTSTVRISAGAWAGEAVLRTSKDGAFRTHPSLEACMKCHDERAAGYAVPPPAEKACTPCHPGKGKGRYVHGPVALGQCTTCHDPHGSPFPALVKSEKGCFACHEPFAPGESVHRPAVEGKCHACHDPHSSELPTHLEQEVNRLCTGCHRDNFHDNHRAMPREESSRVRVPDDFPRRGEQLTCTGCHAPHRSANKRLLREGEGFCKRCHAF